jgi:hypothetical protein
MSKTKVRNIQANEIGGLSYNIASDIVSKRPRKVHCSPSLADAIKSKWPTSHPNYWRMIAWRYFLLYAVPDADAICAVARGYSSPIAAMSARVINRRELKKSADD